jgi:hypothetical protein
LIVVVNKVCVSLYFCWRVDDLETIGQGNDPLTKVIGQGAQAAIELSYEHFPKATEKTLDLIAKHSFLRRIQYNR